MSILSEKSKTLHATQRLIELVIEYMRPVIGDIIITNQDDYFDKYQPLIIDALQCGEDSSVDIEISLDKLQDAYTYGTPISIELIVTLHVNACVLLERFKLSIMEQQCIEELTKTHTAYLTAMDPLSAESRTLWNQFILDYPTTHVYNKDPK